ncbi:molybdopterin synthase sulfur carrier subunit [Vibrio maerlii]|uniref:molybdopterin synthase sulfur carrier subunit n=1 Tax=Vibrio maerlii TaxID=2231648 RepID=UPI000E3B965B|nr:molybdopterin synthase sulfur carrier subunit [Vibrio maerlii]
MIKVLFFAQTKELVGTGEVEISESFATVEELRQSLVTRGDKWELALEAGKLLVAVNQAIVPLDFAISEGDEVAFFPPVTGG